ncbi:META domain-containing protein [Ralstonia solanacearum]|uniref:META domain-containing protein n=1 Tax=Ralstonia solanacearum TaxID=305 RepID=UPI0006DD3627|nr:META domain-containing protein [Ralstonia solanacearum]MCL9842848.1 META domain-containing protein [Ralstonia solanacearum]MDC6252463.1 META domain-containing protein [Ralstonia solanacearum]MDC6257044.1 META domain-containing protein [Ralstonia solanacearum]MDC6303127.1 META domain-containing protein [Ralstonia solanacearum]
MSRPDHSKPSLLQTPRRVVLAAAALAALTAATIIGAGCMTTPKVTAPVAHSDAASAPVAPVAPIADAASAVVPASTPTPAPASAAPNTGQASLAQAQGEGRSHFVLVRWQEPGAAPKELPPAEGEGADPANPPISIEFSAGLEAASGVASGYSSCNRFTGPYEKLVSGMRFGTLVSTRMVCDPARMQLENDFLEALKSPLATVGMQPSSAGAQGRQVIWKTAGGVLLQFAEHPLPPRGQSH